MRDHTDSFAGRFRFLTGDVNFVDYGGAWYWHAGDRVYHVIRLDNQEDCCGRDAAETYWCDLRIVDLNAVGASIGNALESCGALDYALQAELDKDYARRDLIIVEACVAYGAYAPMVSLSGNNWRKMWRECARESRAVAGDASALDRGSVNGIGQTPREYMTGDMVSALGRGLDAGDQTCNLIARMYAATAGQTLGGYIGNDVMAVAAKAEQG